MKKGYVLKRLLRSVISVLIIMFVVFVLVYSLVPRDNIFFEDSTYRKLGGKPDDKTDYGMQSINAELPIEITLTQPKGQTLAYDLHGGMVTVDFTMNWYASGEPTIVVADTVTLKTSSAASNNTSNVSTTMSTPVAKENPEGGYTQYTWQVSFPFIGFEAS